MAGKFSRKYSSFFEWSIFFFVKKIQINFIKKAKKYTVYNSQFLGIVERNYWGTYFEIFDFGLDEKLYAKIPNYFMPKRRSIVINFFSQIHLFKYYIFKKGQIIYQTNIMGEVPRDFSLNLYDFLEKKVYFLI